MKLHELKLDEGLVDADIFNTIRGILDTGITNGAQTVALAKCVMAIRDGKIGISDNFNGYYNLFFPNKEMIDSIKALSKENVQQLANFVLRILEAKDTQLASLVNPTANIHDFLFYATAAEAND